MDLFHRRSDTTCNTSLLGDALPRVNVGNFYQSGRLVRLTPDEMVFPFLARIRGHGSPALCDSGYELIHTAPDTRASSEQRVSLSLDQQPLDRRAWLSESRDAISIITS